MHHVKQTHPVSMKTDTYKVMIIDKDGSKHNNNAESKFAESGFRKILQLSLQIKHRIIPLKLKHQPGDHGMEEKKPKLTKKVAAGWILLFIAAGISVYCAVLMISRLTEALPKERTGIITRFIIELVAMGLIAVLAFDIQKGILTKAKNILLRCLGWVARILLILFTAVLVIGAIAVDICGSVDESDKADHEYVYILGLALRNGQITEDLALRLDRAAEYQKTHPETFFFMTGGNNEDWTATEAATMSRYLGSVGFQTEGNIDWDFLARTTVENFEIAAETIGTEKPIVIITSDYHMLRASAIARKQGFSQIYRVPASSVSATYPENVLWESLCLIFDSLLGHLAF